MIFPPQLYRLVSADDPSRQLDPVIRSILAQAAAASVSADFVVPIDHVLMLAAAVCVASPGAAQNVSEKRLSLVTPTNPGQEARLAGNSAADAVGLNGWLNWSGLVIVPGGTIVRATGVFNAGAAVNSVRLEPIGILIPRGNIERA